MDDFARLGRTEDVPALTAALLPLGDTEEDHAKLVHKWQRAARDAKPKGKWRRALVARDHGRRGQGALAAQ